MIADTSYLLIGRLALQANTTKDTVRHYHDMGLLRSRKRQAGSRLYTEFHPECVERIDLIKNAQAVGFNLNELKVWLNDYYDGTLDIDKQMDVISKKIAQAKQQQANLLSIIDQLSAYQKSLKQMK
ncbi:MULTISPECIES: MerR family transcriptional regulator [unclassified Psychrobacter]|uniref:MerR family transcriptional regulator n=1 Tax=unclassified Psychrobacter TaxID=196806 RepID=UPI003FB96361